MPKQDADEEDNLDFTGWLHVRITRLPATQQSANDHETFDALWRRPSLYIAKSKSLVGQPISLVGGLEGWFWRSALATLMLEGDGNGNRKDRFALRFEVEGQTARLSC